MSHGIETVTFYIPTMQLWLNGRILDSGDAAVPVDERGFTLGDGIYDTMLAHQGHMEFFPEHWARFSTSAERNFFALEWDREVLAGIVAMLCDLNGLERAVVRFTLTRGSGVRGLALPQHGRNSLLITAVAAPDPPRIPLRLLVAPEPRSTGGLEWSHKALGFLHSVRAHELAVRAGCDDAVWADSQGNLLEATTANLFAVVDGVLCTQTTDGSILPGTMRSAVLQAARILGLQCEERPVHCGELHLASECFLTSSVRGISSVGLISQLVSGQPLTLGEFSPGGAMQAALEPVVARLRSLSIQKPV